MEKIYKLLNNTKYVQDDYLLLNFSHLVEGTFFLYVPFHQSLNIPLFILQKLRNTNMGDVCGLNCHLVLTFMLKPIFPHHVNIRKR